LLVKPEGGAAEAATTLTDELRQRGIRVHLDDRVDTSFGRRAVDWELKGVPIRVEVGPRDIAEGNVVVVRRDTGDKTVVPVAGTVDAVAGGLDDAQHSLLAEATRRRDDRTVAIAACEDAVAAAQTGFATIPWDAVGDEGERSLAEQGITVRCLRAADGGLPASNHSDGLVATVARAY
jgi:prolyl-tRNA synthetase